MSIPNNIDGYVPVVLLPNWTNPPEHIKTWQTKIDEAADKSEYRASLRLRPLFTVDLNITSAQISETPTLENDIRRALEADKIVVPFHGRGVNLSTNATGTTLVLKNNLWHWKINDFITIWDGHGKPDIKKIIAINGNNITIDSALSSTHNAKSTTIWPMFYGRPTVPSGFDPIFSEAGNIKLRIKQDEPFAEDYVYRPDTNTGQIVEEPLDLSNIPVDLGPYEALESFDSEISQFEGNYQQFQPQIYYSNDYYTNNDPNTISEARKQFLYNAVLWEWNNFLLNTTATIRGRTALTWVSSSGISLYSAESARNNQNFLVQPGYPSGISTFTPTQNSQAWTLVLYYDEISSTGGTSEPMISFSSPTQPTDPGELFTKYESFHVLDDRRDSQEKKTYAFDPRNLQIGFNSPAVNPIQDHTIHGLSTSRFLDSELQIVLDDFFFQEIRGQALPFWFPSPFQEVKISGGVSATQFDVVDRSFDAEHDDHPSEYFYIRRPDLSYHLSKILSVLDNGNGTERVTIADAASPAITTEDAAYKCHLVRLVGNEKIKFFDEQIAFKEIKMQEVVEEYSDAIEVPKKVYLYKFTCNSVSFYYTSYEKNISSTFAGSFLSKNFVPKSINHGPIRKSTKAEREEITISAVYGQISILDYWVPFAISQPVEVEIFETTENAPTTGRTIFYGRLQSVQAKGRKLTVKAASVLDAYAARVPKFLISPRCNHHLYSAGCTIDKTNFDELNLNVDDIGTGYIDVSGASVTTDAYFSFGWVEYGTGENVEYRSIIKSEDLDGAGAHRLYINKPFDRLTTSDNVNIFAGCDGLYNTCNTKFSNTNNFGGHPFVPQHNLTLKALEVPPTGGKK